MGSFLTPAERRAITLCADVILPADPALRRVSIDEICDQVDAFLGAARARAISSVRQMLEIVGELDAVVHFDHAKLRKHIADGLHAAKRTPVRDALDLLHVMIALAYFSHPKADAQVGYTRYTPRPAPSAARLDVKDEPPAGTYDVVIAGSGPAGSLLAERLSTAGKRVLLLEAGPYAPEPTFTDAEMPSMARLYKDAGLQRANDKLLQKGPSFMVFQGACLGGGSTINNAVCFRLPPARLELWQKLGFPPTAAEMALGYEAVARDLDIKPAGATGARINPAGTLLTAAFGAPRAPDLGKPPVPGFYECLVNLAGPPRAPCQGCGYCNLGCAFERKRNALQVYLPRALGTGNCTIVQRARVVDMALARKKPGGLRRAVESLGVRLGDGRTVSVRAAQYVVAGGAIGSSAMLLRAKDLRALKLPVGEGFSANIGCPVHAFYDEPVRAAGSVQIGHYYMPPEGGFVIETWYNPPGTQATAFPGFLDVHFGRMLRFAHATTAAPLVPSEAKGRVTVDGEAVHVSLPLGAKELGRLRAGLGALARAFLRGSAEGKRPREVVVSTREGLVLQKEADAAKIEALADVRELQVATAHPQGGNAMTKDKERAVVDAQFLVRGTSNLRVCDGSVFPACTGVNPQWTIMALAHHCATGMI
jgi:choline dehydrogenase-like flavoprotein